MSDHRRIVVLSTLACALLALMVLEPVSAQQTAPSSRTAASGGGATKIILTTLSAPSGDTVAEKLASTITSSLEVMMKLSGTLTVRRADFLAPSVALSRARRYYSEVNADGAVYGSVAPTSNGGYRIVLGLWNGSTPNAAPELFHRTISNVLTSFTMADRLALAVTSTIVGHPLHEGTLQLKNTKLLPNYAVYADGHLLARNRSVLPLLAGKREVVIAKPGGPLGDVPVEVFHVRIRGGRTTTVSLSAKEIAAVAAGGKKISLAPPSKKRSPAAVTRIAQHGSTALIRVAAAGRLYLDGKRDGSVLPGHPRLVTGIAPGHHRFEVRYSDGHHDASDAVLSATTPELTLNFSYQPMRYTSPRLFHAASLSVGKRRFTLRSPNQYAAALDSLRALPTVTPGIQSEIAHAQSLVKSWRPQRWFHLLWLGTFWAGVGSGVAGGFATTPPSAAVNLLEIGATFGSILFLVLNAEHRGATRGGLASDLRSITGSFNRQVGGGGPMGLIVAGAKSAGELFVDGSAEGHITPGHTLRVYGLPLGTHVVTMRYPNGHLESDRVLLSKSGRSPSIYFGYASNG